MGLVKTRRLMAMQKQQRAKAGMNAAGTGPAKPLKNGPFVGSVPKSSGKTSDCPRFPFISRQVREVREVIIIG